jgi:hypothetical protein
MKFVFLPLVIDGVGREAEVGLGRAELLLCSILALVAVAIIDDVEDIKNSLVCSFSCVTGA